ncbi:hypothetical protein FQN49_007943 [Arthroderma sp. PD_2]|nr:hypothetical protein FQN49_007943 [Arthroderma sp. PD_2]
MPRAMEQSDAGGFNDARLQLAIRIKPPPNPDPEERVLHNLVVCGFHDVSTPVDGAIFSDFMGVSRALLQVIRDGNGTFLSCFPLDIYFDILESKSPPTTEIKWGKFGENQDPLFTYSRTEWETGNRWFDYANPDDILEKTVAWIRSKAGQVGKRDVVNIFFLAFGRVGGGIALGTGTLLSDQMSKLFSLFPKTCQLNAVGSQCYSGYFTNAIKPSNQIPRPPVAECGPEGIWLSPTRSMLNEIETHRPTRPLARVCLPWLPGRVNNPNTVDHNENTLMDGHYLEIYASLSPKMKASLALLEEMVLHDFVDVLFSREAVHRRQRLEFPSMDLPLMWQIRRQRVDSNGRLAKRVQRHVHAAALECDFDNALTDDGGILGQLLRHSPPYADLLRALYYRGRVQSAMWDIFLILCDRGFLDLMTCLEQPVNFYIAPDTFRKVMSMLLCFELPHEAEILAPFQFSSSLSTPTKWLAVMISRGCANPARLFETIRYTGMLGRSSCGYPASGGDGISFTCDRGICAGYAPPQPFGFWLPHGVGNDPALVPDIIARRLWRFNKTEALFKEYFGLSDKEMPLEPQQGVFS